MEAFSALLAFCALNSPVTGEFPHKGQWRGALMFSLICTYTEGEQTMETWWFETPSRSLWRHVNDLWNLSTSSVISFSVTSSAQPKVAKCESKVVVSINQSHKSHNAAFLLQNDALREICLMHCGVCDMYLAARLESRLSKTDISLKWHGGLSMISTCI